MKDLTFQLVVLRVRRKSPVGEQVCEADPRILRFVHHVVSNSLHQPVHKFQAGCAQNLDDLVPLVDVCGARLLRKTSGMSGRVSQNNRIRGGTQLEDTDSINKFRVD